jgi:glycosyltransferase involved in cell wall biosynthesis
VPGDLAGGRESIVRILSLTYEYPPIGGGGSVVASSLNETLAHFGDEIEVVTSAMPGLERDVTINGVRVHRTPCWRRHRHYTTTTELATTLVPAYLKAAEVIRCFRPDLIHTHFVIPSGAIAAALSWRFGIRFVVTAHGSDIPGYNPDRFRMMHWLVHPLWRQIMRRAALITSPSNYLASLISDHIDVPVSVIPNGYTPGPRLGRKKRNLVLVVTRLFPRKGVQHFIEAVRGLPEDWEFIVAGDGPYLGTLQRQAARLKVPIRFTGFVDKTTLRGLYEEARIMVFPSVRENFPIVLLEGMDAGCAIITTDDDGCSEVIGSAGITVPRGSSAVIREALLRLMHDRGTCDRLAVCARERAREFRWPMIAHRFREAYARVLCRPVPDDHQIPDLAATGVFDSTWNSHFAGPEPRRPSPPRR